MTKVLNSPSKSKQQQLLLESLNADPKIKFAFNPLFKAHTPFRIAEALFDALQLLDIRECNERVHHLYCLAFHLGQTMLGIFSHFQGLSQSDSTAQSCINNLTNFDDALEMYQKISDLIKMVSKHSEGYLNYEGLIVLVDLMDAYVRLYGYEVNPDCRNVNK